ncbi:putative L-asparaginase periplasmic precursor [compost metagenome]|uniref:Asparaginase n=1 Tax=Pseudomonas capeferrum TaxID=1495066 RepID=A0ABY7R6D9_9PSED|nr:MULTISPECIES: asparaginase [Pseudomonas]KEY89964.1 asparaginase [Pseudomonas capeferrum]MBC3481858.1 asparaginase [Pseudomonas sp. SWRI77]MCH7300968.1 asparaginase [Pseudomonas capeferrum]MDD2065917.1 asparaginase [Pseudomonas sp. 25571]MDD2132152.1 asparaginase [Pseudomonas sp. 17391]
MTEATTRLPRLAIASLGGTVSMQTGAVECGVTPTLDCEKQLSMLPELREMALLEVATLGMVPSASLGFMMLLEVLAWARDQVERGAQAVILTQGTDTLEETAYFFDLLWPLDTPLVLTGAMRSASQPGSDGPANILAAAQVALAPASHRRGVLVVINDQIHSAASVRKTASLAMAAFESPGRGPLGEVVEGVAFYHQQPPPRFVLPLPHRLEHRVVLLEACLDADTALLQALPMLGYEGLVIAGFGAGHVSGNWSEMLEQLLPSMPIIVASRTGSGPTARATYGFVGAEIDLQKQGVHMAGQLCPRKCRILLWLLIGTGRQSLLHTWLNQ